MRALPQLSFLFALLLGVSVGGKVISHSLSGTELTTGTDKSRIAALLNRHGFQVEAVDAQPDSPFVAAVAGDCRLLAVLAAPEGWHREITHRLASPQDQVFFVFDGVVYRDPPTWRPTLYNYWRKLNLRFGLVMPPRPVLGIVASPACDLAGMQWGELAGLS